MATEIIPDTDELMLRDIEATLTAARTAFDAKRWEEAALRLSFVFQQAFMLRGQLLTRVSLLPPRSAGDLA